MNKVLVILTGGISSDGISSAWFSLCKSTHFSTESNSMKIDFLEIEEVSDSAGVNRFKELGYNILTTPVRQSSPLTYINNLRKILRDGEYKIIHVNGSSSFMLLEMVAAKLENINIRIAHSRNTTCNNIVCHKILSLPFRLLTNLRLACGDDAGKWLFGKSSFTIFHNGINLNKFKFSQSKREEFRNKLGLNEDVLAFGHVGKFNYQKNHHFLIHTFAEINKIASNSKLFLFGDGNMLDEIKNLVKNLQIENCVIFCGVVSDIEGYLQAMDEMILPSRFEGLPNVVIEWQASGLPSLLSDTITNECAVTELVKFKSLKDSPKEWAQAALELLRDNNRIISSLNSESRLKETGFDIENQSRFLIDYYKQALSIF